MTGPIPFSDYLKVDIRVGTVTAARLNEKARKPAYVLEIDFGDGIGVKQSSAQLTDHYTPDDLVGRQVLAVVNFAPRNVAGIRSDVLVLGAVEDDGKAVLVVPAQPVKNGIRLL